MHVAPLMFLIGLPVAAAATIIFGDEDDRIVAAAQIIAFGLTLSFRAVETRRFATPSIGITVIDVALLLVVAWSATRTRRWWMILTASLLIFPPLGHLAKLVEPAFRSGGYWLMTNAPAIPCMILLAIGAFEARQRRLNAAAISPSCSVAAKPKRTTHTD